MNNSINNRENKSKLRIATILLLLIMGTSLSPHAQNIYVQSANIDAGISMMSDVNHSNLKKSNNVKIQESLRNNISLDKTALLCNQNYQLKYRIKEPLANMHYPYSSILQSNFYYEYIQNKSQLIIQPSISNLKKNN